MRIKTFVKRLAPPVLLDIYRTARDGGTFGPIWSGVYPDHRAVPVKGLGHEDERWVRQSENLAHILLAAARNGATIPANVRGRHVLLPLVATSVCRRNDARVRILDFGGSMGTDFIHLSSSLSMPCDVDYYVVEGKQICDVAKGIFSEDPRIHFSSSLPAESDRFDIVLVGSTLQYVEEYKSLLGRLSAYEAEYILLSNLPAGDIEATYATEQRNLNGSVVAAWFFRVSDVVGAMEENGYSLLFKAASEEEWDQSNFPESRRIGRPCHLLFGRN